MKKITTIGGGTGQYVLLSGLKDVEDVEITAIVSMVDSGGSTGRLRDELGVLPPGDILKCTVALSPFQDVARRILQTKLSGSDKLNGHNAGNMLLSMLSQYAGNFPEGVRALGEILSIKGRVLPVTIDRATLVAELTNGIRLYGESAIDIPRGDQREKIKEVYLVPHHSEIISVYDPVIEAIEEADYLIIGPGDIYTSIIPNFLVPGVKEAIKDTKAKLIYVTNVMTKYGETDGFTPFDFLCTIENYIGRNVDYVIVNNQKPPEEILNRYGEQRASFVLLNEEQREKIKPRLLIEEDLVEIGEVIRHNSIKLSSVIKNIF
ncbi:MAG: uridine diphosphate-N-acetylglucosamine-binding protein YvcK [Patescibacteria group bacterium]|jgi:uncharacterized cofD-like protein